MSWEIKVWHQETEGRTRLSIEAEPEVPDDVISTVAGSYWFEEVQYTEVDWEEANDLDDGPPGSGQRLQG